VRINWADAVVVVTGGSRGIGRAVAEAAAAKGARVGLLARSEPELMATLSAIGGHGAVAVADVGQQSQVEQAVARLRAELGPVDVLVNNAGIGAYGSAVGTGPERIDELMRVNFFGTVHATTAVVREMIQRGRGHVVMVGSIAGLLGAPLEGAYSATKFAVTGYAESLAVEVAPYGVGLSLVQPGPVDTGFFETRGVPYARRIPRPVSAERVARAVIGAVEHDRFETIVPRWLRVGVITRAVAPGLYRTGAARAARRTPAAHPS
jgi:short-subunit dehydrogenase